MVKQHNKATKLWPHEQEKKATGFLRHSDERGREKKKDYAFLFLLRPLPASLATSDFLFCPPARGVEPVIWVTHKHSVKSMQLLAEQTNHTFSLGPLFLCFFSCSSSSWFSFSMRVISVLHRRCNSYACVCVCACVCIMTTVCCV